MVDFWSNANAFLPHDTFTNMFTFLTIKMPIVINMVSTKTSKLFLIGFLLIGFIAIIKDKKIGVVILTCVPLMLHLFLSTFQLYPFDTRLILYTLPCIAVICSLGFEFVLKILFHILKIKRLHLFAVIIPILFLSVGHHFKLQRQEIKKSITYINENTGGKEPVYIYHGASRAFRYYYEIGFANSNMQVINCSFGDRAWGRVAEYVDEIKTLHGANWLLFTHFFGEDELIINQLDSIGYTKLDEFQTVGSSAYLYDFGE
jgi:hypothetical protein